jgi:hypothetical protein
MCLRLLSVVSNLDVRTAHYYDLLSGLIRDYLQDMRYSCNMSPPRASLLPKKKKKKSKPACRCLTPHIHASLFHLFLRLLAPVLLIQYCYLMAIYYLSFSKIIPRHPSDHLQFIDHSLFCSMDTLPLYDTSIVLAASCEVPLFRTFVSFFIASL